MSIVRGFWMNIDGLFGYFIVESWQNEKVKTYIKILRKIKGHGFYSGIERFLKL